MSDIQPFETNNHLPSSKRDAPRFLGDGMDGEGEDNIDGLFEDLDDEDGFSVPAPIDHDAMDASLAQLTKKRNDPFAPSAYDDTPEGAEAEGSKSTRVRRLTVKLNEDRLLNNPEGFQKLIQLSKTFEVGPKGSEKEGLKRVLKMYQMWTHVLYPKARFGDAIETIEKLCRKRPLQAALKKWREDAAGPPKKRKSGLHKQPPQSPITQTAQPTAEPALPVNSTSAPLFRQANEENLEFEIDEDFDQLLQGMDVSASAPKQTTSIPKPLFVPDPDDEFAEEEALMREYEEFEAAKTAAAAAAHQPPVIIAPGSSNIVKAPSASIAPAATGITGQADEPDWDDLYS
ncbi:hypothetical protein CROQUDRAFT_657252 [Cronartium quercuum f. sp. fusiforme G11]|uniref:Chromosome segregation in meiosis protein n=1 Tax=Cronartium quercuum f. sp. fusiforme G11 TaxID=708437 RepID=A0A9P6TC99_9BASI|nr:hypothetical protein CROQUDRAFT_657252 [Cronartium quercuum f. sp. fusiforme G11]